jgi:hypothetical protein
MPDEVLTAEVQGEGTAQRRPLAVAPAIVFKSDPWEQQEGEGATAYGQFSCYRDLPPEERSQKAAWQQWRSKRRELGEELSEHVSGGLLENYARWRWEERARAYDVDQDRRARRALERRRFKAVAEIADLGETLRRKASSAIRMMSAVEQRVRNENGQEVIVLEVKITPSEAIKMAEVGSKLEMLALGEPTERIQTGEDPNSPFGMVSADAAKDELRTRIEQMQARKRLAMTTADEREAEPADETRAAG